MEDVDARIEEIMKERKDDDDATKSDHGAAAREEENELTAIRIDELDEKYAREIRELQAKVIAALT